MSGTFNGHILVDKLAKLNNSQQSIETLSHWCIFHRNKARQVVETWNKQFHCTPPEKQVSFLYLANDILQNSRRKGLEFVTEFWKVLPDALNNVLENGDEFGKNTVLRLVNIWEERKVFGSRGQVLKVELLGRNLEGRNRDENFTNYKLKRCGGDGILEKLISDYKHLYDGPVDEEALFGKCQTAISCVEKVEKEIGSDFKLGSLSGSRVVKELEEQHSTLRECIEQLKALESSRITLVSHLGEAIHEQELKIEQVRNQLKIAQSRYELVGSICQQLLSTNLGQMPPEQRLKESEASPTYIPEAPSSTGDREQSAPVRYIQQGPFHDKAPRTEEEQRKTAAAAVAAKLAASTSSAQMLSFVLSSLASEGVIGPAAKEDSSSCDPKRPRLENVTSPYIPPHSHPSPRPFPQLDAPYQPTLPQPSSSSLTHPGSTHQPQMLPSTMPPMAIPPPPATQFMQVAGSMTGVQYSYGSALPPQRLPPFPGFPMINSPPFPGPQNPLRGFQSPEGVNLFNQSSLPMRPPQISRP